MPEGATFYSPAQIERLTGIPMNTLRAWERRYSVPKPERGPGGHRMYSESDVQTLLWLQKQLGAGIPIGHAIAGMRSRQPAGPSQRPDGLVEEILAASMALDERRLDKALSDALAIHPVERVCMEVLLPVLQGIGQAWEEKRLPVTVEHFASSQIQGHLHAILRTLPAPAHRPLLFVATAEGELHAMPALILTVLLRRAGWRALYFGANLPIDDLLVVVPDLKPDYMVLSVTMSPNLDALGETLTRLRAAGDRTPIVVGGQAFNNSEDWGRHHGVIFLGNDMEAGITQLARLTAPSIIA